MNIRTARESEAPALTRLARRAKASWGYPEAWLAEWEPALTFTPAYIRGNAVFVAERAGRLVGVVALEVGPGGPEIGHLWVDPGSQRLGVGRALMTHAVAHARERGWRALRIESDPNARGFYERLGATPVGEVPAPVAGVERTLPVLRLVP